MNKAVFFDRDGTIAVDVGYCRRPEDFKLFPAAPEVIHSLNHHNYKIVVITNQSGISRGFFDEAALEVIHAKMRSDLAIVGAHIDGIYYCPHHPNDACDCRKPKTALIRRAAVDLKIDLQNSFVVGDLPKDIEMGRNAGCHTILIQHHGEEVNASGVPDAVVSDISEVPGIIFKWANNRQNRTKS
jgi:D-glycero-D-manno-heptose 1,7-bisphosphate phosphatase